jgi:HD-GYP domain-containing protein (c-di-GMP phosphodiesterase class II)
VIAEPSLGDERVRAAEIIAALSLATDLAMGLPLEHGLESTLVAMRLGERLGVDPATAAQTYYGCQLFYVGCTADAEVAAEHFEEDIHQHLPPAMFGSRTEVLRSFARAIAPPGPPAPARAARVVRRFPKVMRGFHTHLVALCEVAQMLTDRVGLPGDVQGLFGGLNERWDGKGLPGLARGEEIPFALRIVHVARDATLQRMIGGEQNAVRTVRERAGGAFDPRVVECLVDGAPEILALDDAASLWDEVLALEPSPPLLVEGDGIDRALGAMGDFGDLISPYLAGHSSGVADLAARAADVCRLSPGDSVALRRAALVHDIGRVAVPTRIWQKPGPLSQDEWERVRLHPYHTERVLSRSPFLAALAPVASAHHERLDGSGYHRGAEAAALTGPARLLAAADAYRAMTEPRPHREPLEPAEAAAALAEEARAGRLDPDAVSAVLEAAGQDVPRIDRPAGLTEREAEVVGLLARGLQTKQVAAVLGISVKTADRHVQNAYAKMGVSTRAAAALFAMQHGLVAWGELPIGRRPARA